MPYKDPAKKREAARRWVAQWRKEHPEETRAASRRAYHAGKGRRTKEQLQRNNERVREWKRAHPEVVRAQGAKYRAENLERERLRARTYAAQNRASIAQRSEEWRKQHPDRHAMRQQAYRARKARAAGRGITSDQWQQLRAEYNGLCVWCNGRSDSLELDHIDPLSRGGAHDITNAAPACSTCNASKNNAPLLVWLARRAVAH